MALHRSDTDPTGQPDFADTGSGSTSAPAPPRSSADHIALTERWAATTTTRCRWC